VVELLEGERAAVCGTRYRHDCDWLGVRGGHVPGSLVLGGWRVAIRFRLMYGANHLAVLIRALRAHARRLTDG
jgi:hypothetical protein